MSETPGIMDRINQIKSTRATASAEEQSRPKKQGEVKIVLYTDDAY